MLTGLHAQSLTQYLLYDNYEIIILLKLHAIINVHITHKPKVLWFDGTLSVRVVGSVSPILRSSV